MVAQREHDALVASYRHLRELPRADDALLTLKKIASLVKPIMRARAWTVSELCEFYPSQQNLLGKPLASRAHQVSIRLTSLATRSECEQGPENPPPSAISR